MKLLIPLAFLFSLVSCTLPLATPKTEITSTGSMEEGVERTQTGQSRESRLEESKRRKDFRSVIRKWDYFSLKNDRDTALRYYLNAYVRLKDDNVLERKIAGAYFDLKDFGNAYKYFIKVPFIDLDESEKKRMLTSLMFDEGAPSRIPEMEKIGIGGDDAAYYGYVENCYTGIHNCVTSLQSYSGSAAPIKKLQDILENYQKVSSDFQYRNILLAGAFFETKQYLAGAKIATEITQSRPDYKIAYKIAGYCSYELGRYQEANSFLSKYYEFDSKDVRTTYTLGLINYYLEDYTTSNLYFNTAVLGGYTPKTELERRLLYNYYTLGDKKGMFKIFRYLLQEPDVTEDDFIIAVHVATEDGDRSKGFLWANGGLEKFPDSDMLWALRAQLSLLSDNVEAASADLEKAHSLNPKNPLTLLGFAKLHFMKNNYTSSREYIQSVKELDGDGTFSGQADELLRAMENEEKAELTTGSGVTAGSGVTP